MDTDDTMTPEEYERYQNAWEMDCRPPTRSHGVTAGAQYYALNDRGPVVRKSPHCGWDKLTRDGWEDVDVQRVHENAYEISLDQAREIAQRVNPDEAEKL